MSEYWSTIHSASVYLVFPMFWGPNVCVCVCARVCVYILNEKYIRYIRMLSGWTSGRPLGTKKARAEFLSQSSPVCQPCAGTPERILAFIELIPVSCLVFDEMSKYFSTHNPQMYFLFSISLASLIIVIILFRFYLPIYDLFHLIFTNCPFVL